MHAMNLSHLIALFIFLILKTKNVYGIEGDISLDYIPEWANTAALNRQKLIPQGYEALTRAHANEYFYVLDDDRVCKMKLLDNENIGYIIQSYGTFSTTLNVSWWNPNWFRIHSCSDNTYFDPPKPRLCFWHDNGPHLLIEQCGQGGNSVLYSFGKTNSNTYNFKIVYDVLAYDYVQHMIYVYVDAKLFKMKPENFINIVAEKEFSWDTVLEGNYEKVPTDWSDILVVDGKIYYIFEGHIYLYKRNNSQQLSQTNSDGFPYVLIPLEKKNILETTTSIYIEPTHGDIIYSNQEFLERLRKKFATTQVEPTATLKADQTSSSTFFGNFFTLLFYVSLFCSLFALCMYLFRK